MDKINFTIQETLPDEFISFKSIDTMADENEIINYPTEILNSLDSPGFLPYDLRLKISCPIILFRRLNTQRLCNKTRLIIEKNDGKCHWSENIKWKVQKRQCFIVMYSNDSRFKRLQFSIRLTFAMIIYKWRGQTVIICVLVREHPCFSHGRLYVACSRVEKLLNLYIYAPDGLTRNIVNDLTLRGIKKRHFVGMSIC